MNMEDEDATYVKLESLIDVSDSANKQVVLNSAPLVICSESGVPSEYMPCIENGQIVLRQIENSRLDPPSAVTVHDIKVQTEHCKVENGDDVEIQAPVILNSLISLPRKKLSYESTFTPSVPVVRGGVNRGIIRYGSKHLIIDQHIRIPPREFKRQLTDTDDLVTNLELAPSSKPQMHRMLSGFTRMFAYPAHRMPNAKLLQLYASHCVSSKQENMIDNEEMDELSSNCGVPFDFTNMRRLSRKRKLNNSDSVRSDESVVLKVDSVRHGASLDHKYSKQSTASDAMVQEEHTNDSLSENGETFLIIDDSGANLSQNNLEILLAAASETSELNQIVTICEENDVQYSKRIIIVANDKIEQILGAEY